MPSDERQKPEPRAQAQGPAQEMLAQDWLTVLETAPIVVESLPPKLADELAQAHAALRRALNK